MATFKQEIESNAAKANDELAGIIAPLVDQIVAKTLEAAGLGDRPDQIRETQLKLKGYEIADVARPFEIKPRIQALKDLIAASPTPVAASAGKFKPQELLQILEARCEAFQIAGARDLKTSLRANDDLTGLKKILATKNEPYIVDQCDRILAITGLLYN